MNKNFIYLPSALLSLLFMSEIATADTRYTLMDKDQNNSVDLAEFMEANSNMSEGAFGIIDLDKNKALSLDEWLNFVDRHSRSDGFMQDSNSTMMPARDAMPPDHPEIPQSPEANASMPPKGTNAPTSAQSPAIPESQRPSVNSVNGLPLLSAPSVQSPNAPEVGSAQKPNAPKIENTTGDLPLLTPPTN